MVPKRSFLVTSGKCCYFLVELFHTETSWCQWGGQVTGSQCASVSQAVETLLRYFLTVLSWALPKKQGKKPRRWGGDAAVVGGGTALAAAGDTVTYWKRGRNVGWSEGKNPLGSGISSRSCRQWIKRSSQVTLCLTIHLEQEQSKADEGG